MQPTAEDARQALLKLLSTLAGPANANTDETQPVSAQIAHCIERTKTEASEGAALIDACVPHGRAMLTQAQKRLETLEALKVLESVVSENLNMHQPNKNPRS